MAGEKRYTRIPPESTGDRVYMVHTAEVEFKNGGNSPTATYGNHDWKVGERYDVAGFGMIHIHGVYDRQDGTGILAVHYSQADKMENNVPDADSLISVDGVNVGEVVTAYDVYIPAQNIMGYDNPEYGWNIDRFGSGPVTFAEGPPLLTGFGSLKVDDARLLATYDFNKSNLPNEFVNSREGGSAVSNTWDPITRGVKLAVGVDQGDRVTQTSNLFHSTEDGASMLFILAARSGDAGKENVARNWGSFDATDGYFFQIKGSDVTPGGRVQGGSPTAVTPGAGSALRVVHRYTFNGTTGNHEILQNEWNKDTLLGTGGASNPSGMQLDVTKINAYWIDYQYLGGGRTRWGVFYKGDRIVCHEMIHGNAEEGPMTQNSHPISNPNRPVCWAMANYGTTGSSSEFYAYGAGVFIEAATDPLRASQQISIDVQTKTWGQPELHPYWRTKQSRSGSSSNFPALLKSGTYSSQSSTQYAMTLSPEQFLSNGDENHSVYQPVIFQLSNHEIETGDPSLVEIRAFYGCVMRGLEFDDNKPSTPTVLFDEEGDHLAHVVEIGRFVVDGSKEFNFSELSDNFQYGTVRNLSDQKFSRALQPLAKWTSNVDRYSTGQSKVVVEVGPDPVYGSSVHYFADKQPVVIREVDGDQVISDAFSTATTFTNIKTAGASGYASADQVDNPANWHYISLIDRNEAWLYNSQADIDDDRLTRTVDVDDCTGMDLGQTFVITSGNHEAKIMKIDVDKGVENANVIAATAAVNGVEYQIVTVGNTDYTGNVGAARSVPGEIFTATATAPTGTGTIVATSNGGTIAIVGRSSAQANYIGAFTTNDGSSPITTLASGTASNPDTNASLAKDYWTSINALSYTDLGMDVAEDLSSSTAPTYTGLALFGNPNPRAAWTFMIKHLDNPDEDADGDQAPVKKNSRTNWNIFWREKLQ